MSEVHFSTQNLQPFASNYRSTANTYNFIKTSQVHFRSTVKLMAKIINCLESRPLLHSYPEVVWLRPPQGVHRAHLHQAYKPCFIRAVPPQTYIGLWWLCSNDTRKGQWHPLLQGSVEINLMLASHADMVWPANIKLISTKPWRRGCHYPFLVFLVSSSAVHRPPDTIIRSWARFSSAAHGPPCKRIKSWTGFSSAANRPTCKSIKSWTGFCSAANIPQCKIIRSWSWV